MDDLIGRHVAIDALKNMYEAAEKWGCEVTDEVIKARAESCMASLIEMKLRIEKLPSAQPEIIKCKDCKWSDWYTAGDGSRYCYCMETGNGGRTENDFCSFAERETDE